MDAVQPPPYMLEATATNMVRQKLTANPVRTGLAGVEIAALLKRPGLEAEHVWSPTDDTLRVRPLQ